jgi:hypothetical protein
MRINKKAQLENFFGKVLQWILLAAMVLILFVAVISLIRSLTSYW